MSNVAIIGLAFSQNLGDGLISECLSTAVRAEGLNPYALDLAGRIKLDPPRAGGGQKRELVQRAVAIMPKPLRNFLARPAMAWLGKKKWTPGYKQGLVGAHCAVIGGGQLLDDHDLHFPTKLAHVIHVLKSRNVPYWIAGVGIGRSWSKKGLEMVQQALAAHPPKGVTLRDEQSVQRWASFFAEASKSEATICYDFGLLTPSVYALEAKKGSKSIGLGLMSPAAIQYHSGLQMSEAMITEWWLSIAWEITSRGHDVVCFTNGSGEDRRYLARVLPQLTEIFGNRITASEPETPRGLCELIANLEGLFAFRMHAIIAAYSLGVPSIAFYWDDKTRSFLHGVSRVNTILDIRQANPVSAVQQLFAEMETDRDDVGRVEVVKKVKSEVKYLSSEIRKRLLPEASQ